MAVWTGSLAPQNAQIGDIVATPEGGNWQIVEHGTPGSNFNPQSGFSSIKLGDDLAKSVAAWQATQGAKNTALSQSMAREQMEYQSKSSAKAMDFSAAEAQKNREFQERMSNTAHQRMVNDLLLAGLNPVLATMGQGATTPAGSSAQGYQQAGSKGDVDNAAISAIGGIYEALINQETQLNTSAISADAILGSTILSGLNQLNLENSRYLHETILREEQPQTMFGSINALVRQIVDGATGSTPSGKSVGSFLGSGVSTAVSALNKLLRPKESKSGKAW